MAATALVHGAANAMAGASRSPDAVNQSDSAATAMRPFAQIDGHDALWLIGKAVQSHGA
jgi:hypothetical protein